MGTKRVLLEGFIDFLRNAKNCLLLKKHFNFIYFSLLIIICINSSVLSQSPPGWFWLSPLPTGNSLNSLHYFDLNTGIIVGEAATMLRTTDAGVTWNKLPQVTLSSPSRYNAVSFSKQNPNIGYAVGTNEWGGSTPNIIKTTNGGINWFTVTNINNGLMSVFLFNDNIVWVTKNYGSQVCYSTNGGTSWNTVSTLGILKSMMSIFFLDSLTAWSVGQDGTIAKSTNGGFNWAQQTSPHANWWMDVKFVNSNTGFIAGDQGNIAKTTNGGTNWIIKSTFSSAGFNKFYIIDSNNIWAVGDPYVSGNCIVAKSTNNGENWSLYRNANMWAGKDIFFNNPNTGWIVGSDGEIVKSTDGGMNWSRQYFRVTDYFLTSTKFLNENTGWVAGNAGKIYKTTNGGINWQNQSFDSTDNYNCIHICDSNILYIVGYYGKIIKSTNGGSSWMTQTSVITTELKGVQFRGYLNGWIAGFNGALLQTTNGGTNWNVVASGTSNNLVYIQFVDSLRGWTTGSNKTILKTTNGGANWFAQTVGFGSGLWIDGAFFIDSLYGWLGSSSGNAAYTTNGGTTWNNWGSSDGQTNRTIYFINRNTGWMTGGTGIIYKTTNGGKGISDWSGSINTYHSIWNIFAVNSNIVYAVGEGGLIFKTISGGENYYPTITIMKNNVLKPIMYNQTIKDTIEISLDMPNETNLIYDINIAIDTVINTVDSGLVFTLYHQGIYDTLIYRAGGAGNNFVKTILNDSATTSIQNGNPPFTGQFRPYRPLSQFNNQPVNGKWILMIYEGANKMEKTGVIKSWGITVSYRFTSGMINNTERILKDFKLYQNYPNPFNPSTKIKYKLANSSYVTLKIYDILGKEIITLVNGIQKPGIYELPFSNAQLSSGIYFYRLVTDSYTETRKMVMLK